MGGFVSRQAHTNDIESLWAILKRGITGTYHKISPKHLNRYATEFAGRHNAREPDTIQRMEEAVRVMDGRLLRYQDLLA